MPHRKTVIAPELLALPPAQTIVLSPSDRARRAFSRVWAREAQRASGRGAAMLPQFATIKSYLATLWEESQLFGLIDDQRSLLAPTIEAALWRHIAGSTANTSRTESAVLGERFAEAWALEHGHRDGNAASNTTFFASGTNGELYRAARKTFVESQRKSNAITQAELAHTLLQTGDALLQKSIQHIIQTPKFYGAKAENTVLSKISGNSTIARFNWTICDGVDTSFLYRCQSLNVNDERAAAIAWAQRKLEDGDLARQGDQVAIVVPDLQRTRGAWQRALRESGLPFNVSLGLPVSKYPWAAAGFTLVNALFTPIAPETIAQALRHPRWGRSDAAIVAINRRELELLRAGEAEVTLFKFCDVRNVDANRSLLQLGERLATLKQSLAKKSETRRYWQDCFERSIEAFSEATLSLDSQTFQLRQALLESIEAWQRLDDYLPRVSIAAAQQELIAMTDQAAFQPEGSDAPIQVIGLLESAGVPFDAMWVTGMSERVLPESARANPFLSIEWQREQRVGLANIEACEERATRLVEGWQALSNEVMASMPRTVDDEPQVWSPLVVAWPEASFASESNLGSVCRDSSSSSERLLEVIDDETAPRWQPTSSRGARALEAQALCPRRGFAEGRLKLEAWPKRSDGLSPQVRGELVHDIAERLGNALKSTPNEFDPLRAELSQHVDAAIEALATKTRSVPTHVWRAERERLVRVFTKFINVESTRNSFAVNDVEHKIKTKIGELDFSLRIDRVDRVERIDTETGEIAQTGIAVIDFKSGNVDRKGVFDDRLTAPQLPLYASALGVESIDAIDAIAFAQVSDDYQRYIGVGTKASGFEAAKRGNSNVPPWEEIRTSWASKLETLVNELIEGDAALAPAYGKKTCDTCSFERFCRIDLQALQTADDASDNEEATDS